MVAFDRFGEISAVSFGLSQRPWPPDLSPTTATNASRRRNSDFSLGREPSNVAKESKVRRPFAPSVDARAALGLSAPLPIESRIRYPVATH
ncbi:Hypothetical protein BN69_1408 [Methylocystis sp. SC2]|nr:Hypothetical protein BN69_1408 [Methylocystis sp. SC2]